MKTKSAKAKGRRLQNWVKEQLIKTVDFAPQDVKTAIMGESGPDVYITGQGAQCFPYHIECKSRNKFSVYSIIENIKNVRGVPLLVIKEDSKSPLVVIDAKHFFEVLDGYMTSQGF